MDLILILLILILPAIAQWQVTSNYNRYRKEENNLSLSGQEVARKILDANGLENVYVVEVSGTLSDHYDPSRKVVRLSKDIFHGSSVASLSIAAHECGHAIQDKEGYAYMRIRSFLFPVVRICTQFSYLVILLGILMQALQLVYVGIALVGTGLIFQLVTLPVEFDASKRAEAELKRLELENEREAVGVFNMLKAAAMTYVAGVLSSALDLVRLILAFSNNKDR